MRGRRPKGVFIPKRDLNSAITAIEHHLNRMYTEASDYRTILFYYPVVSVNQTLKLGGSPQFTPYRDRRFFRIQLAAYNQAIWSDVSSYGNYTLTATVYNGASKVLETSVSVSNSITTKGYRYNQSETVVTAGKDNLNTSDTWNITITTNGPTTYPNWEWADISVEVTYEDFSPYVQRNTKHGSIT